MGAGACSSCLHQGGGQRGALGKHVQASGRGESRGGRSVCASSRRGWKHACPPQAGMAGACDHATSQAHLLRCGLDLAGAKRRALGGRGGGLLLLRGTAGARAHASAHALPCTSRLPTGSSYAHDSRHASPYSTSLYQLGTHLLRLRLHAQAAEHVEAGRLVLPVLRRDGAGDAAEAGTNGVGGWVGGWVWVGGCVGGRAGAQSWQAVWQSRHGKVDARVSLLTCPWSPARGRLGCCRCGRHAPDAVVQVSNLDDALGGAAHGLADERGEDDLQGQGKRRHSARGRSAVASGDAQEAGQQQGDALRRGLHAPPAKACPSSAAPHPPGRCCCQWP